MVIEIESNGTKTSSNPIEINKNNKIQLQEVQEAITTLKNRTSPGVDNIKIKMLKYMGRY